MPRSLIHGIGTLAAVGTLSPTVAGPLPGVNITAPNPVDPAAGARIAVDKQPLTLTVENATTSGVRPLSYVFEVAIDADFNNKVFVRDSLAPGEGGRTSLRLPDALATGRSYYWRSRAQDGANTGPYSPGVNFNVFTPIVIEHPVPLSPINNAKTDNIRPAFQFNNAPRSGPVGAITYVIELSDSDSFANKVAIWTVAEQPNQTTLASPQDLAPSKQYFWHVRAYDPTTAGPWSATQVFQTPAPIIIAPPPTGPGTGPAPGDQLDLRTVTIVLGPGNFASWPVGSNITAVQQGNGQLCIYHEKLGRWPSVPFFGDPGTLVEGNQWVFANIGGRWYGGAADWYRPGQACKAVDANSVGRDAFYNPSQEPLHSWVPQPGELFGVAASTPARAWPNMATLDQRTNIVLLRWQ
jgi:hypothetical protein